MNKEHRVLIAEDEPLMRNYLEKNLSRIHPAFLASDCVHDGRSAISSYTSKQCDLLITDIRMPGMDGLKLIEALRESNALLPVIILSGYDEFEYARSAVRLGVTEYLLKPLNDAELHSALDRVANALEARRLACRPPDDLSPESIRRFVSNVFSPSNVEQSLLAERAANYICAHYAEPLTQPEVAEKLGVTPAYLSTVFHEEMGESYSKFLTRLRMTQAALLLRSNPSMTLQSVAEQTGYLSDKHFIGVFKKFFGVTPNEYRHNRSGGK